MAGPATIEVFLDIFGGERSSGWATVDDCAHGGAVRFAKGCKTE